MEPLYRANKSSMRTCIFGFRPVLRISATVGAVDGHCPFKCCDSRLCRSSATRVGRSLNAVFNIPTHGVRRATATARPPPRCGAGRRHPW